MLARIRNSASPAVLTLLMASTVLATSCAKEEVAAPATAVEQKFTGQDLFRGVFFLEGEVARKVPYLAPYLTMLEKSRAQNPALAARKTAYADQVVRHILSVEPGYFADLRAAVDSKDFNRIDQTMLHGAYLVEATTQVLLTKQQQQRYQQGKSRLSQLDLSKYDFRSNADLEKFTADAKAALAANADDSGAEAGVQMVDAGHVFVDVDEFAVAFATSVAFFITHEYSAWIAAPNHDGVGGTMLTKANLEKEMLIKQIALNLN